MKDDPNVSAAGASVEAATVYTTYAEVEASYVARSLCLCEKRRLERQLEIILSCAANSNRRPNSCQGLKVLQTWARRSDICEV